MDSCFQVSEGGQLVDVVLEGGPEGIAWPLHQVSVSGGKIKVPWCGWHEHFERVNEKTFRWTMRTAMAE